MPSSRPLAFLVVLGGMACVSEASADDGPTPQPPFGIERRIPWTTSRVVGSPEPPPPYRAVRAFPRLVVEQPLSLASEPGTENLLIIQHLGSWAGPGRILRVEDDPDVDSSEVLLEFDRLAYGLAFHPDYERNGYLFVVSNGPVKEEVKKNRVSRFTVDRRPPYRCDPASELVILEWESNGHNGGELAFGPDGTLYISSGDGTSDSDTNRTGQTLDDLLAAVLRIDVDHPDPGRAYSIPKDNPFVDRPGACPEIWAYGFRNPWRLTYDLETDQLWVGNNGQDLWEQVYLVRRGANYGWSLFEGSHPFQTGRRAGPDPISGPTVEHHHSEARSLTGGIVYHGARLPELRGAYLYGDFSTGRIWGVRHDGRQVTWHRELADTTLQITGFGADRQGELYVVDQGGGFYRLEPTPDDPTRAAPAFPTRLSETGLFASVEGHKTDPALIPYSVNAPLWSDGASKERFIALPGDSKIEFTANRGWNFPEGAVLVKTFSLPTIEAERREEPRRIETRLLTRQQGEWVGYSYLWDDDQADARLVSAAGMERDYTVLDPEAPGGRRRQTWHYPSRAECMVCHSRAANFVLGPSVLQMNRVHDYGGVADNQLRTLEHIGVFRDGLPKRPEEYPRLADPYDPKESLDARARSYVHANCAQCHVGAGGGNALMELEFTTDRESMKVFGVPPQHDRFGIAEARLIAPGEPERSILYQRMTRRGPGQMPPLATSEIDRQAAVFLADWIRQLPAKDEGDAGGR